LELRGRTLLEITATTARQSKLSRVVLSTDDPEIAEAGRRSGIDVPFMRPTHLALDTTPTVPVLQDVVIRLESAGETFDAVFTLQPTNPLRLTSDIDGAIDLLFESGADSVIGFCDVGERHPARMKLIGPGGHVLDPPFAEEFEGQRRQELPKYYLRDGAVYLTRRDVLMEQNSIKGRDCRAWLIPPQRSLNIDTPFDIELLDFLLALGPERYPGRAAHDQ
jgi:CMP-N-acetylneuraminic acid synthetase